MQLYFLLLLHFLEDIGIPLAVNDIVEITFVLRGVKAFRGKDVS